MKIKCDNISKYLCKLLWAEAFMNVTIEGRDKWRERKIIMGYAACNRLVYYISNYPAHHYFPPLSTDVSLACLHTYAYLITCITSYASRIVFSTSCSTRGIHLLHLYYLYEFDLRSLTKGYSRQTLRY